MALPDLSVVDRQQAANERPVVNYAQSMHGSDTIIVLDTNGDPLDLTPWAHAAVKVKDRPANNVYYLNEFLDYGASIPDPTDGTVTIPFTGAQLTTAGPYYLELLFYLDVAGDPDEYPSHIVPCYMHVEPSLQSRDEVGVRISDVREALKDRAIQDNFLIDDIEFSNAQILWATFKVVETYNNALPPVGTIYSGSDFAFRSQAIDAVVAELLLIAARNYSRNSLQYSAGNVTIHDKERAKAYLALGGQMSAEFKAWATQIKIGINISAASGAVYNDYFTS